MTQLSGKPPLPSVRPAKASIAVALPPAAGYLSALARFVAVEKRLTEWWGVRFSTTTVTAE